MLEKKRKGLRCKVESDKSSPESDFIGFLQGIIYDNEPLDLKLCLLSYPINGREVLSTIVGFTLMEPEGFQDVESLSDSKEGMRTPAEKLYLHDSISKLEGDKICVDCEMLMNLKELLRTENLYLGTLLKNIEFYPSKEERISYQCKAHFIHIFIRYREELKPLW